MRDEVLRWCREQALFAPGDRVICAVSGGADSMAMLWCLLGLQRELGISVSAAHFNHRLRGVESDRDEVFVRDFCAAHGIALQVGSAQVSSRGMEEAARESRYAFLKALSCDRIATAHNADDNAETVLMHLLRGSGLRGLCGIPPKRERIVRPLLSVTRGQITDFLKKEGISWVEDSTNAEDDHLRNRIRHHVLPQLRQEVPELPRQLLRQSEILRGEDALLDEQAEELLRRAEMRMGYFSCNTLLQSPEALRKRAIRVLVRRYLPKDVSQHHIELVLELLTNPCPSAQLSLPKGVVARRSYELLTLEPGGGSFRPVELPMPGEVRIPERKLKIFCEYEEKFQKSEKNMFAFSVKCDRISPSIIWVRPRQHGDALSTDGGHHVSLKKLFIDRKIPREERELRLVFAMGEQTVAVEGIGVDARFAAAEGAPGWIITIEKEEL